jgi:hypothetical protein
LIGPKVTIPIWLSSTNVVYVGNGIIVLMLLWLVAYILTTQHVLGST